MSQKHPAPARSHIQDTEDRHCSGAAMHAQIGAPRDRAGMSVGTCVHHMNAEVAMREPGQLADEVIEATAVDLVANGRRFEGGPVEYPTITEADAAMQLALGFLDRDEIPGRESVDWMRAELSVGLDRDWKRCDPAACSCADPLAIWQGTVDLATIHREDIDDETLTVVTVTDWKGGNISPAWLDSPQGKGAALIALALCPEADIVRTRVVSYFPWGGKHERDLDLRQEDDTMRLEDYRRSILMAARAHRMRQGKTPDELARPGAGCSGGFGGCPWLLQCRPFADQWAAVTAAGHAIRAADPSMWASLYALSKAVNKEAAKRVKKAIASAPGEQDGEGYAVVETVDGASVVGYKRWNKSKVTPNAPAILAREYVELVLRLGVGTDEAVVEQARFEGLLRAKGALGVSTTRALIERISDVMEDDEAAALKALCLEDASTRELATWKKQPREPTSEELQDQLRNSKMERPTKPPERKPLNLEPPVDVAGQLQRSLKE